MWGGGYEVGLNCVVLGWGGGVNCFSLQRWACMASVRGEPVVVVTRGIYGKVGGGGGVRDNQGVGCKA